jgi:3-oxoacyl-[acyl-carrier protein] reductase
VQLASRGAHVLVHYHSDRAGAEQVLSRCTAGELLTGDLSTSAGVATFIESFGTRPIDILVNNAGSLIERKNVLELDQALWERVLMLNLTSAFLIARAVLSGMVERKRGAIVNVGSVAARNGGGLGSVAYATAKGGIATMTRGMAREFGPHGIRVNAVAPGIIDTNYHKSFSTEPMLEAARASTPLGRLGTSEEIASAITFLCSGDAGFVHGEVVEIDGGFWMA